MSEIDERKVEEPMTEDYDIHAICRQVEREFQKRETALRTENASLTQKLKDARKCELCGGTDLVCSKGWQEQRQLILKKLADMDEALRVAETFLKSVATGPLPQKRCDRCDHLHYLNSDYLLMQKYAEQALASIEKSRGAK